MADRADAGVGRAGRWWASPPVWALGCWIAGTLVARSLQTDLRIGAGTAAALAGAGALLAMRIRAEARVVVGLCGGAIVAAAMSWWSMASVAGAGEGIAVGSESRLARFEGVIVDDIYMQTAAPGVMGRFDYRSPRTLFLLRAEREFGTEASRVVRGAGPRLLIVDSPSYDGRVAIGDRVRVTGWLSGPRRPLNPGEADRARWMRDRGVVGRLTLGTRGNCELLATAESRASTRGGLTGWIATKRRDLTAGASWALRRAGPADRDPQTTALLGSLLLGESRSDMGELGDAFRDTGLNHVLAISGLHLTILAAGVWFVATVATGRPGVAAVSTLAALGLYVLIVPPQAPVLRAAIMTAVAAATLTWGRRPQAVSSLALAALLLLVWRPGDLFAAGFQLSFVIVAALVLFAGRFSERMRGSPLQELEPDARTIVTCRLIDFLSVSVVAWCFATPLAAYHFELVTPLAIPMGLVILPAAASLLWLGFATILVTAIAPEAGEPLGAALWTVGDATSGLVRWAADLPRSTWSVASPGAAWCIATLMLVAAIFSGTMARRRGLAWLGVAASVMFMAWPAVAARLTPGAPPLRVAMFAVGDGSAYLLRSGGETMMFDCGSGRYLDITTASVGPALRRMGVTRIDTLVLSHGDLDHFSGAVELMHDFGVARLVVTQEFIDEATHRPGQAASLVIDAARAGGVAIVPAAAGWRDTLGEAGIEALWPPAGRRFERSNDGSLVLRITAGERRVLLSGDVQQEAMTELLASEVDLRADVLELPHHGSFVDAAPAFVARVDPSIVLQSSGPTRLRQDKWAGRLDGRQRHITAVHGMTELTVGRDGSVETRRFVPDPEPVGLTPEEILMEP